MSFAGSFFPSESKSWAFLYEALTDKFFHGLRAAVIISPAWALSSRIRIFFFRERFLSFKKRFTSHKCRDFRVKP